MFWCPGTVHIKVANLGAIMYNHKCVANRVVIDVSTRNIARERGVRGLAEAYSAIGSYHYIGDYCRSGGRTWRPATASESADEHRCNDE